MATENQTLDINSIISTYELGFHDQWPEVLDAIVDMQNSGNLDEHRLKILLMVLDGWSFREIGRALGISHNTVIKHLKDITGG